MESDVQTIINTLAKQRNDAMDAVAHLSGVITLRDKRIAELESAMAALSKQLEPAQE